MHDNKENQQAGQALLHASNLQINKANESARAHAAAARRSHKDLLQNLAQLGVGHSSSTVASGKGGLKVSNTNKSMNAGSTRMG